HGQAAGPDALARPARHPARRDRARPVRGDRRHVASRPRRGLRVDRHRAGPVRLPARLPAARARRWAGRCVMAPTAGSFKERRKGVMAEYPDLLAASRPQSDLRFGDCLDVLRELPDASIDAIITDPPYG